MAKFVILALIAAFCSSVSLAEPIDQAITRIFEEAKLSELKTITKEDFAKVIKAKYDFNLDEDINEMEETAIKYVINKFEEHDQAPKDAKISGQEVHTLAKELGLTHGELSAFDKDDNKEISLLEFLEGAAQLIKDEKITIPA